MDGMNNNVKVNNDKKGINWVVVVLVLIIIALGSFIVYDKVLKKDDTEPKTNVTDKNDKKDNDDTNNDNQSTNDNLENVPKVEEITVDKTKVDELLEKLQYPLAYAFEGWEYDEKAVIYNQELLNDNSKFNIAWGTANQEKIGKWIPEDEVNYDLGNYYIDYNSFKNLYKRLYGVEFDGNLPTNTVKAKLQGEILYGFSFTGYTVPVIYLTTNKVVKEGDKYTVTVDAFDRETKTKKHCQLQIVAEKVGNAYQFKSIMIVK